MDSSVSNSLDRLKRNAALACCVLCSTGCAGGLWSSRSVPDVHPVKAQRAKETAKHLGEQRDRSELEAAKFAWQQDDVEGCHDLLDKLLQRNPRHREGGLLMAELLLVERQTDQAREQLKQVLKHHPNDAEALHAMGLLLEAENKPAEARVLFQQAAKAAPANDEYKISYKAAADRAQPSAVADDRTSIASKPAPANGRSTPTATAQAASLHRTKSPAGAVLDRPEAPVAPGDADDVSFVTATDAIDAQQEPKSAAKPQQLALAKDAKPLVAQGDAALAAGARDSARRSFREAQRAAPDDPSIPLAACVSAIKHDELELAVEIAHSGITAFPESAGLYRALGTAQYRLGDLPAAKASFERAISLDKAHPLSYFLMGSTLKKLGQTEAAEQYFRQARQLDARYK
ncbi:MAG TPA: tetratricopeptide repeat protein [Pirellulales bacterium]|nr:tetratricopeptide repeat protein [Pirellulales bacterium]